MGRSTANTLVVNKYEPDYANRCENCGESPTVTGVNKDGKVVYAAGMCGPCTFGTAKALDPDWWNE